MKPNLPPPKDGQLYRVASYIRVSVEDNRTGSHTLNTQRERIQEKLDAVYGAGKYTVQEFSDNGASGGYGPAPTGIEKRTRKAFKELTDVLRTGTYDALAVYDLSRYTRSPRWFEDLLEDVIQPFAIAFISATEEVDLTTPEGVMMARMLTTVNGMHRDNIKKRMKDAVKSRLEEGYPHGQVPYGWEWEPKENVPIKGRRRIFPVEEEAKWVIQMKDWYLSGWQIYRIAAELNKLGVTRPSGSGLWDFTTVIKVLVSPIHAGYVGTKKGGVHEGEHHDRRFYDFEDYERILELRDRRKWRSTTQTGYASRHLVNGIVACARCGKRLYPNASPGNRNRNYTCKNGFNHGERTCPDVKVNADELEAAVVARIEALARQPDFEALLDREAAREASVQEQRDTERREHLARELASLKGQFTRWAEMATRGTITEEQFREYNQDLLTKRTSMEAELAEVEKALENRASYERTRERVQEAVRDFPEIWARLNPDERRGVIDLLVEWVTVDREGRTSTIHLKIAFLPEEVFTITLTPGNQRKPKGVDSLSPRQLAMLHHHRTGKKTQEIAEAMGVLRCCINQMWGTVRERLGVYDKDELVRMATKRLNATLPTLPLGPDPKRPEKPEVPILSDALMEVFPLLASGATSKEVARVTGLAKVTVDNRRVRIIRELGVQTIFEAGQKGRTLGILT